MLQAALAARAYDAQSLEEERHLLHQEASLIDEECGQTEVLRRKEAFGNAFARASLAVREDREVCLAAVLVDGELLMFCGASIREDFEVAVTALMGCRHAIEHVAEPLRGNKKFMLQAVEESGFALKWASEELRGDREVVLAAAQQHLNALAFASEELREDPEFMLEVTAPAAIASEALRGNRDFVIEILRRKGPFVFDAWVCASPALKADKDVLLLALRWALTESSEMAHRCHDEADESIRQSLPFNEVVAAAISALACPGEEAPAVTVVFAADLATDIASFNCEVIMLSARSFPCVVVGGVGAGAGGGGVGAPACGQAGGAPTTSRLEPIVNDLAKEVLKELPKQSEVGIIDRVFITLQLENGSSHLQVGPWDWQRPLKECLHQLGAGGGGDN